jgi:3-methylfumaryl-CoA hydratase
VTGENYLAQVVRTLQPGSLLPEWHRTPTRITCFLFAVAWWAPHRVHYDIEWARQEGLDDVMVPGLLISEYVVTAITSWSGDPCHLRRLAVRNTGPAFAGENLTVRAQVAEVAPAGDRTAVTFDFSVAKDGGQFVATGQGTVEVTVAPGS